jgi:hypothetical protein
MITLRAVAGLLFVLIAGHSVWDAVFHYRRRNDVPWGRRTVLLVVLGDLTKAGHLLTNAALYGVLGVHVVPTLLVVLFGTGSFVAGTLYRLGKWERVPERARRMLRLVGWPLGLAFLAAFIPEIRWGIVAAKAVFLVISLIGIRRIWRLAREDPAFVHFLRREMPS